VRPSPLKNRMVLMLMIALLLLSLPLGAYAQFQGKKVVMVVPSKGFWDIELTKAKEIFEQNGLMVTIASSTLKEATGMFGTKVKPNVVLSKVGGTPYDAIVLLGGEGAVQYWDDPQAHRLIKEALRKGKVLGAISIAPIILSNAKILKGKKATVWPTLSNRLKCSGAIYTGNAIEVDGNIVTADRPDSVEEFANAILRAIPREKKSVIEQNE
jgi:protease I